MFIFHVDVFILIALIGCFGGTTNNRLVNELCTRSRMLHICRKVLCFMKIVFYALMLKTAY